MNAEVGVWIW